MLVVAVSCVSVHGVYILWCSCFGGFPCGGVSVRGVVFESAASWWQCDSPGFLPPPSVVWFTVRHT